MSYFVVKILINIIGIAVKTDIKQWQERIREVVRVENKISLKDQLSLEYGNIKYSPHSLNKWQHP